MGDELVLKERADAGGFPATASVGGLAAVLALFVMLSLIGCRELLVEPASEWPAALSLSVVPIAVGRSEGVEGSTQAFDAADRVRIRLLRGGQVVVELDRAFASQGAETRIQLEVDGIGEEEVLQLEVVLFFQGQALFEAGQLVVLRQGENTEAEVSLEAVPARVEVEGGPVVLEAIGAQAQLAGAVVFATGHPIAGLHLSWASSAPSVVQVDGEGRVTALDAGEAQITGSFQEFSGSVTVRVDVVAPVHFPDPNLEAAIRSAIGKPSGDILQVDLAGLTSLVATGVGISDLTGLEFATALEFLSLDNNSISDITPLEALNGLRHLELRSNSIADITPLRDLVGLTFLGLNSNAVSDLTPMQGLTELRHLEVRFNSLSDITPLHALTALRHLALQGNSISDVTPLQGLPELLTLGLEFNSISDVTPLQALVSLKHLDLHENSISDITPLQSLTDLTFLFLGGNSLSDSTPLQGLTGLTILSLNHNPIFDLTPLQGLTELTVLFLHDTLISDVIPLQGLTGLTLLHLSTNSISDITPLQGLTGLTVLFLSNNSIADLTPLEGLTGLTFLDLENNSISDVQALVDNEGLGSGDEIFLFNNPLSPQALCEQIPALNARGVIVDEVGECEP